MSVRVIQGDCRTMLATLPDNSVQCVCTSPPYYGLRSYGIGTENGEIGLEQTPDAYVAEMVGVFREVRRVLRDDGTCWLNLGDSYCSTDKWGGGGNVGKQTVAADGSVPSWHVRNRKQAMDGIKPKDLLGIPWMVAFALRADGWWLRSDIIWAKPNPMPESCRDRPTSAHEHVFLLSKRERYFYDADAVREEFQTDPRENYPARARITGRGAQGAADARGGDRDKSGGFPPVEGGRNLRNVWTIATQPFSGAHFATMPPDLAERCVKAGTSERGQCPHCGSPWARVVERERDARPLASYSAADYGHGAAGRANAAPKVRIPGGSSLPMDTKTTTGWRATCACPEHKPVPQTVLDPFGGAGTTGLVADRLGRNAVLIELNPQYASLARARVVGDAPLFAEVAD